MKKEQQKMFIVRKHVMASSVAEAIRKERMEKVSEVFIDDEWRKNQKDKLADAMGFSS